MGLWKTPPKAKVYEALSAVADNRVEFRNDLSAEVTSSDRSKKYFVRWTAGFKSIVSNDNASYWQGYLGYPIIAVLMKGAVLRYDESIAALLGDIQWKKINQKFRNKYDKAIESVMADLEGRGIDTKRIHEEVDRLFLQVENLSIERLQTREAPPTESGK